MEYDGLGQAWAAEPNRRAGSQAFLWALATYVAVLVVVLPREDAHSDAYLSGELVVPAVLVWVLTWIVAHFWDGHWPWWVYAVLVPPCVLMLTLALNVPALLDRSEGRTPDGGTRADSGPLLPELVVPESQGAWTRLDTAQARQAQQQAEAAKDQFGADIDSVVLAYYAHTSPAAKVVYVGINGTIDKGASLEDDIRNAMGGAQVDHYDTFNPGSAKGVLGCGNTTRQGQVLVTCMWIGNQRAVSLTFGGGALDHQTAADLTTQFRDLAAGGTTNPSA